MDYYTDTCNCCGYKRKPDTIVRISLSSTLLEPTLAKSFVKSKLINAGMDLSKPIERRDDPVTLDMVFRQSGQFKLPTKEIRTNQITLVQESAKNE